MSETTPAVAEIDVASARPPTPITRTSSTLSTILTTTVPTALSMGVRVS